MAIRLGDIRFLNSWPVTYALRRGFVRAPIRLVSGTPADLNRRLLTGELDASAVSSMVYLRHPEELVPVPGLCVQADRAVASVLVVSRTPLERLKASRLGVSNQGATTPVLLELLLRHRKLALRPEVTSLRFPEVLKAYPAALLIGDEALRARREGKGLLLWDLAESWTAWTRRPCVFALWVVRRSALARNPRLVTEVASLLRASHDWGRNHPGTLLAEMREAFGWEEAFLRDYLGRLSYRLDDRAWEGLKRLSREAETAGFLPAGTARRLPAWSSLGRSAAARALAEPAGAAA